jgi:serine/threonine-protein kinase
VPESNPSSSDTELRALAERALGASYELDREIGRGGMGIVYRAKDRRLKRTVAIKVLPPELAYRSEIRTRFLREAETAAQLNHPNIVPIYSVDDSEGLVFFVMTCVDGKTLARELHERGTLDVDQTRRIMREVADALAYAHGRGVVHRDIKPDNILLDAENGRAMVTDFGIARAVQEGGDSRLTATGMAIGTPAYMSPEQAVGDREIDGRSDLYSLGIVAYQMLTGAAPFSAASTPAMLMKHLSEVPAPVDQLRSDVPQDLSATIMTLLEKEPERRFPSANALLMVLEGEAAAPMRPPASAPGPRNTAPAGYAMPQPSYFQSQSRAPLAPYNTGEPPASPDGTYEPTHEEYARWNAEPVQRFRRRFAYYAAVNLVIVIFSIFTGLDLIVVTAIWSIFMAAFYGKLWSAGYDWRDVFRQTRDRRLVDVAGETVDDIRAVFDKDHRPTLQSRRVSRSRRVTPNHQLAPPLSPELFGSRVDTVRQAEHDRNEISRLIDSLPKSDRQKIADVIPSASALFDRVRSLAQAVTELERTADPNASRDVDSQIARLESEANPLDRTGSEERVRRLALLKRQRRALADQDRKRQQAVAKLESCALALGNMRLDVLRLRAGNVSVALDQITTLTERARSLADEVDAAVYAADEVAHALSTPRAAPRG